MACYSPLKAFKRDDGSVVFHDGAKGGGGLPLSLPCGQCIGCRLERSRQWAVRCLHESKCYDENCFLTLTYDDDHLPLRNDLNYSDFQLFMKRFRKYAAPKRLRFYMCGEYGPENGRPHFHACIFGFNFPDRKPFKLLQSNCQIFKSKALEELWPFGFSSIGAVTFESAAYVARYCVQKVTGDAAKEHYKRVDPDTGEVYALTPEFNKMSLKPGIGAPWLERFGSDVFRGDEVIIRGKSCKPPRYYDKILDSSNHDRVLSNLVDREWKAWDSRSDNTPDRLAVKEQIANARFNLHSRKEL